MTHDSKTHNPTTLHADLQQFVVKTLNRLEALHRVLRQVRKASKVQSMQSGSRDDRFELAPKLHQPDTGKTTFETFHPESPRDIKLSSNLQIEETDLACDLACDADRSSEADSRLEAIKRRLAQQINNV
jgi:hypothetical protein